MGFLSKLSHLLFKAGSQANTASILLSGNPKRLSKHVARRTATKASAKLFRKLLK